MYQEMEYLVNQAESITSKYFNPIVIHPLHTAILIRRFLEVKYVANSFSNSQNLAWIKMSNPETIILR